MTKAEEFIRDYTNHCSNEADSGNYTADQKNLFYIPWLTPDQARKAVEIAREEVIEWIDNHWREYANVDADGIVCFGHWKNDLRKAMKDE